MNKTLSPRDHKAGLWNNFSWIVFFSELATCNKVTEIMKLVEISYFTKKFGNSDVGNLFKCIYLEQERLFL